MSEYNENLNFRCPMCLNTLTDVPMELCEDGSYRCIKCSFVGTREEVIERYNIFRARYKNGQKRFTLEMQREL